MPDFADAAKKVERAIAHIQSFDAEAGRHFRRGPFEVSWAPFRHRGRYVFGIGERIGFPDRRFSVIIGDAVHNLRSALDYLIAACAAPLGADVEKTEFPIRALKSSVKAQLARKVAPAGFLAARLVMSARPYLRGNRYLYALHELDRRDKHRFVVPVASVTKVRVSSGGWNDLPIVTGETTVAGRRGRLIPVPAGYEHAIMTEAHFEGEIVFAGDTPLEGEPCLEALRKMLNAVIDVMAAFENAYAAIPFSPGLRVWAARCASPAAGEMLKASNITRDG